MNIEHKKKMINEWYKLYAKDVFNAAYFNLREFEQSEDLTQDVFIKAFNYLDSFRWDSSPKTWLVQIARNLTIDYLRKKKPIELNDEVLKNIKSSDPSPETILQINEKNKELFHHIHQLKVSFQEIIIYRKVMELTINETAKLLNCSESKVKTSQHRAMKLLKKNSVRLRKEVI